MSASIRHARAYRMVHAALERSVRPVETDETAELRAALERSAAIERRLRSIVAAGCFIAAALFLTAGAAVLWRI